MANVDKQILSIIDIFKKKESTNTFEGDIIVKNIGCRFDLRYESLLSTLIKVDYNSIIRRVLEYHKVLDSVEVDPDYYLSYYIGPAFRFIPFKEMGGEGRGLTCVIQNLNLKNIAQWMFMCSVIGNILSTKYLKKFIVDILLEDTSVSKNDLDELSDLKLIQCEIPQMTINEKCRGKNVRDMKVDDFEIWNYYYDSMEPKEK